ncbi:MAG: hypothetical protein ACYTFA_05770 [Planctomycetota bacterium]
MAVQLKPAGFSKPITFGMDTRAVPRYLCVPCLTVIAFAATGCNAIFNAWLDPTVVGNFSSTPTMEIRTSLSLEDTPFGIPGAVGPSREDLELINRIPR